MNSSARPAVVIPDFIMVSSTDSAQLSAQPLDQIVGPLSVSEARSLHAGRPIAKSVGSRYTGQIVAPVSIEDAWAVLTDYEQFARFLPKVVSSQILQSEGDRHVIEQVSELKVLFTSLKSRVRTETVETPQQRIDFHLLEGDLNQLDGSWHLYPVVSPKMASQPQTLIRQTAQAEANNGLLEGAFSAVFMQSMKENLAAIRQEAMQRAHGR